MGAAFRHCFDLHTSMLAWMGGKQRVVQLAKHQAAQRGGGGGSSSSAVAAQDAQQQAGRGRKRRMPEEEDPQGRGQVVPAAAVAANDAAHLSPRAPKLKRVAAVHRSLDLLALQMPRDWPPAAAAADGRGGTELSPALSPADPFSPHQHQHPQQQQQRAESASSPMR